MARNEPDGSHGYSLPLSRSLSVAGVPRAPSVSPTLPSRSSLATRLRGRGHILALCDRPAMPGHSTRCPCALNKCENSTWPASIPRAAAARASGAPLTLYLGRPRGEAASFLRLRVPRRRLFRSIAPCPTPRRLSPPLAVRLPLAPCSPRVPSFSSLRRKSMFPGVFLSSGACKTLA